MKYFLVIVTSLLTRSDLSPPEHSAKSVRSFLFPEVCNDAVVCVVCHFAFIWRTEYHYFYI